MSKGYLEPLVFKINWTNTVKRCLKLSSHEAHTVNSPKQKMNRPHDISSLTHTEANLHATILDDLIWSDRKIPFSKIAFTEKKYNR